MTPSPNDTFSMLTFAILSCNLASCVGGENERKLNIFTKLVTLTFMEKRHKYFFQCSREKIEMRTRAYQYSEYIIFINRKECCQEDKI